MLLVGCEKDSRVQVDPKGFRSENGRDSAATDSAGKYGEEASGEWRGMAEKSGLDLGKLRLRKVTPQGTG